MDNTVGRLTKTQESIIIGSLLGDGYIRVVKGRKNAFLEVNHAFSAKKYVDWKYERLKDITNSPPKSRKGNGKRVAYRFYTKQHPEITKLFRLFYRNGVKVVPNSITLDPVSLAVWYMDDGSKCSPSDYYFNTQQFALVDQYKLIKKLKVLNIGATLNKDKEYCRIRILKSSIPRLKEVIRKNLITSLQYKI